MSPDVPSAGSFSVTNAGMALIQKAPGLLGLPASGGWFSGHAAIANSLATTLGCRNQQACGPSKALKPAGISFSAMLARSAAVRAPAPERVTTILPGALIAPSGLPTPSPCRQA